jgi:hypothetical protein
MTVVPVLRPAGVTGAWGLGCRGLVASYDVNRGNVSKKSRSRKLCVHHKLGQRLDDESCGVTNTMSGPIVRKYGFPNFDKIFGERPLEHGAEEHGQSGDEPQNEPEPKLKKKGSDKAKSSKPKKSER